MTDPTDAEAGGLEWLALPQPTTAALTGGEWRPSSVLVATDVPEFAAEAARLERELVALGIPRGDGAVIRLRTGEPIGEAFRLTVGDDIEVVAGAPVGVFRATRQLLHNLRAQGAVPHGRVQSAPAVEERGFHLDAARKYFPADWMVDLLHALADVGINSFQWHLSENEGFRIGSDAFPEIVSAQHVTRDEARRVADAAADLHIDLVPSLDMPGHLRHALAAHPEFRLAAAGGLETDHGLDIANEDAVRFAQALIDDIAPLFPRSTSWNLGGDEFVDFARIHEYPALVTAARERYGADATGFDLLTAFVNRISAHLRSRGFDPRVWNDGMLRSSAVELDCETVLTWWTNWHAEMRPLADAIASARGLVNFNDSLFYYVLGEKAGYEYPTSERIWGADWHPGLFPSLPGGVVQEIPAPYPAQLIGVAFSVWSDAEEAQTPQEVAAGIRRPLRAMAERAWNGGSSVTHDAFCTIDVQIGLYA
ncbi:family 20 glycosylhydrolase [Microbacterium sp. LWH12-1.2]|uniref:family 20 glycosylhydrolase n=1 Tax=Microbacterium sp. LWH12-1.2 TaxID=3135259 RepID=UPI003417C13E